MPEGFTFQNFIPSPKDFISNTIISGVKIPACRCDEDTEPGPHRIESGERYLHKH